jgi:hypothetical protein
MRGGAGGPCALAFKSDISAGLCAANGNEDDDAWEGEVEEEERADAGMEKPTTDEVGSVPGLRAPAASVVGRRSDAQEDGLGFGGAGTGAGTGAVSVAGGSGADVLSSS